MFTLSTSFTCLIKSSGHQSLSLFWPRLVAPIDRSTGAASAEAITLIPEHIVRSIASVANRETIRFFMTLPP